MKFVMLFQRVMDYILKGSIPPVLLIIIPKGNFKQQPQSHFHLQTTLLAGPERRGLKGFMAEFLIGLPKTTQLINYGRLCE